jgi:diguanylate cyclase (GGDEF)-like protein
LPGAELTRSRVSKIAELAVLGVGGVVALAAAATVPKELLPFLGEYLLLALVARALSVPFDGASLQLEAAAIFPAVVLCKSWEAGVLLAFAAVVGERLLKRRFRLGLEDLTAAADLVLAYGTSCFFFVSVGTAVPGGLPLVLLFAATLLVFFFVRLVVGALHALADTSASVPTLVRAAAFQLLALLLLSPVVALIVMVEPEYGFLGSVLAFTSVALVSASLRNLARARQRTEELARQNRELETLRALSQAFATAAPDAEVFTRLFRILQSVLPVRALAIASYEDEPDGKGSVWLLGQTKIGRKDFQEWLAKQRDLEAPFLASTPSPRIASGSERALVLDPSLSTQVVLPLQTPELIAGVLVVESDAPALTEQGALRELSVIADHVALSLQDRSLRRQMQLVNARLEGRAETLYRILEVSNELKSHLSLDQVLLNIVRAVASSLGFDVVLLSLYDRQENVFERRAQVGLDASWEELSRQRLPREELFRYFAEGFRISKSYFVSHSERASVEDTARRRRGVLAQREWHPNDLLFIPLTSSDSVIGVIQVDRPKSGLVPRLEDVQALEIFANQAVTAIQSARAYETTRQMSVKDSLTEAFNHRHFQETLYREMTRHERSGQPLALIMLDIDDFKQVNDRCGHPSGDLVLRGIVEELLKGVRDMDTVARYGGEEFALILPETDADKAYLVADRLRCRVAGRIFMTPDVSHPISVTISLGVAVYPDEAGTKRELIERADQALYQAKRTGKNCVVRAAALEVRVPDAAPPAA